MLFINQEITANYIPLLQSAIMNLRPLSTKLTPNRPRLYFRSNWCCRCNYLINRVMGEHCANLQTVITLSLTAKSRQSPAHFLPPKHPLVNYVETFLFVASPVEAQKEARPKFLFSSPYSYTGKLIFPSNPLPLPSFDRQLLGTWHYLFGPINTAGFSLDALLHIDWLMERDFFQLWWPSKIGCLMLTSSAARGNFPGSL